MACDARVRVRVERITRITYHTFLFFPFLTGIDALKNLLNLAHFPLAFLLVVDLLIVALDHIHQLFNIVAGNHNIANFLLRHQLGFVHEGILHCLVHNTLIFCQLRILLVLLPQFVSELMELLILLFRLEAVLRVRALQHLDASLYARSSWIGGSDEQIGSFWLNGELAQFVDTLFNHVIDVTHAAHLGPLSNVSDDLLADVVVVLFVQILFILART